jgi:hypothetical protein
VSIPAALLAAIGNGVVAGAVIAATTPAGFDESSFTIGAVSGTILLVAMALSGLLLLGSPAWTNVAGRILGAWLVAIAGLLLALPAASKQQPIKQPSLSSLPSPPTAFPLWCRLGDG